MAHTMVCPAITLYQICDYPFTMDDYYYPSVVSMESMDNLFALFAMDVMGQHVIAMGDVCLWISFVSQ